MNPLPPGPFSTGLIDPPWSFLSYSGPRVPQRAEEQHYDTMSLDELKALPVGDILAKDAVLHMWVIDSHLDQAIALGSAWGLTYKTVSLIWCKTLRDAGVSDEVLRMGLGKWTRKEAEFCLLFTKGKPKRKSGGVRQVIFAPRREHSRKPDEQYQRIMDLSEGPYIEMFARQRQPGWSAWGNEVNKFTTPTVDLEREFLFS